MRLDQIERSGSVTDEEHNDIDYFNIDDSTNSFAASILAGDSAFGELSNEIILNKILLIVCIGLHLSSALS